MIDQVRDMAATATSVLVLIGLAVRFVLYPWIRDQLLRPMAETHRQVTENHHQDARAPTIPDRIEDVSDDVKAMVRVIDEHLAWSDRWTALFERRLERLENGEHYVNPATQPGVHRSSGPHQPGPEHPV